MALVMNGVNGSNGVVINELIHVPVAIRGLVHNNTPLTLALGSLTQL